MLVHCLAGVSRSVTVTLAYLMHTKALCLNEADRARLVIRPMARYFPKRSYGVTVRRGKVLSPQARAFIELIRPDLFAPRQYDDTGHSER